MKYKIVNFRADRISGWFYDPAADGARGMLDLLVDGAVVATLECKVFRQELPREDFPNRNVGFAGTLPPDFWTGQSYIVSLRDHRTGTILTEQTLKTENKQWGEPGFSGDFQVTDRGEVTGWVAGGRQGVGLRVFVDGQHVEDLAANGPRVLVGGGRINLSVLPGYAFSVQLPAEYFDDAVHDVLVVVDPDGADVHLIEEKLLLESRYARHAADQTERLRIGKVGLAPAWRREVSTRDDIMAVRLDVTPSYAAVTVSGSVRHRRAVLRLGEHVVRLAAVQGLHPEDHLGSENGHIRRYAAEIPQSADFAAELSRYRDSDEMGQTYDLRLGDEFGGRPAKLPEHVTIDSEGTRLQSLIEFEAGGLHGWYVDTAEVDSPAELTLRACTPEGRVELAGTTATLPHAELLEQHGVGSGGGYHLPLPGTVLQQDGQHLELVVDHGDGEQLLWEDQNFHVSDDFLLSQALESKDPQKVVALCQRLRSAGRLEVLHALLARHKDAAAALSVEILESALTDTKPTSRALQQETGAVSYWVDELWNNSGRVEWFTQNAIRNRLSGARDVLAYAASVGRFDFSQLHGLLESARAHELAERAQQSFLVENWNEATLCLARFLYCAPRDEIDYLDSLTLYRMVEETDGLESIRGADRAYYGDLLTWRGNYDGARSVLNTNDPDPDHDYSQRLLALNAINPHVAGEVGSQGPWWQKFNTLLEEHGITGMQPDSKDLSFYGLTSELTSPAITIEDGPLVTVVVPIYEPSAATNVAVDSLLGQTWMNLEILLMDDCSPTTDARGEPTGYRKQLEELAARDSRIRLVFHENNRGSYSVRNDGLDLATGEFVTVADKDDWHHPQQIELQVRHLQDHPEQVANMTNWVRVDEHLKFMLRSATGRVVYPSMPSLMFRREKILNEVGYWDTVRKSGDSEFKSRLENYYGTPIEPIAQAPLAFALMEGENLTRDDMGVGYLAPDRRSYLRAYKRWHRAIREESASPYMPKVPDSRLFVAPPSYLPSSQGGPSHYDVVFASEFGFVAGNSTSLFTEISVCLDAGLKVAIIPFQNGLIPSAAKRQFNAKIDHLVLTGQIDRISLDTEAFSDLLIVRWPAVLQVVRDQRAGLKPERAVVVANHPPFDPGGRRSYDVGAVTRNVERLFGVRPTWAPQSEQIGSMIQPLLPASDLEDFSWKGIIAVKDSASVNRYRRGKPVIGRHGRDDPAKWPSKRTTFRKVYPVDGSVDVCILGGANVPKQRGFLPRYSNSWEVFAFNEIDVDEYLREKIDFFVYFHSDDWVEAFDTAILEAMSYGVVCILPQRFQPVFREAALYATPETVQETIFDFWDYERYRRQQRLAAEFVEEHCTPGSYLERLERLGINVQSNSSLK